MPVLPVFFFGGEFGRSALSSARLRLKTLREDVELMAPSPCVSALFQVCQRGCEKGGLDVDTNLGEGWKTGRHLLLFFSKIDLMLTMFFWKFAPGLFGKEVIQTNVDLSRIGLEKTSLLDHQMIVDA